MSFESHKTWKALASRQRRAILAALRGGPKTTSELVELFPKMTRFAVMRHISVLRESNLVHTRGEGRSVLNILNVIPLRRIYQELVDDYQDLWAKQLLRVKDMAERDQEDPPA